MNHYEVLFPIGSFIRRKNHFKQRNKPNSHPRFKVLKYGYYNNMWVVEIQDLSNKKYSMSVKGLDWYEKVT